MDNANPSRVHTLASRAADHLAGARQTVARFINAADASEIVFVRGTTEGVNLVASAWGPTNLRSGDEIVISIAEHSSNLMPWTRLARERGATVRVVNVTDEGRLEPQAVEKALSTRSRIVALTHVSNVLGAVNPIKEICAKAHEAGARVVVDGAQGVPHMKIDVRDLGCDFYIFSGHKMLGPMATGVLWGRRELLDSMPPYTSAATWLTLSSSTALNSSTALEVSGRNSRRGRAGWSRGRHSLLRRGRGRRLVST